jgi:DNA-binding TFAR19-related protein (PDSD5 family)
MHDSLSEPRQAERHLKDDARQRLANIGIVRKRVGDIFGPLLRAKCEELRVKKLLKEMKR